MEARVDGMGGAGPRGGPQRKRSQAWSVVAVGLLAAGLLLFFMIKNLSQGPNAGRKQAASTQPAGGVQTPPTPLVASDRPRHEELSALSEAILAGDHDGVATALRGNPRLEDAETGGGQYAHLTPLHIAVVAGSPEIVQSLLAAKAPVDAQTPTGETPLMLAAAKGRADVIVLLADAGATVDQRNEAGGQGRTALMLAVLGKHPETVRALLGSGASVNVADQTGATALALAAEAGASESIQPLLEAGANPDAPDSQGVTPLMRGARSGTGEAVILLLNAGASPAAKDARGRTALDHARDRTDADGATIVPILVSATG
jgi:hypothetical protein